MPETPQDAFNYDPVLQRLFLTPEEKASKDKGKAILKAIYTMQTSSSDNLNFFRARSARWQVLSLWAKGSQNIQEFLDYMNVSDANKSWVNIDTTQTRIAAQFVGTLIESMAKNKTYPCVNAVDDGSVSEKEQRMRDALHRMQEVETIQDVQQQSGIQMEPTNAYVPDDELSAKVYFELEDKLPKEIRFEQFLASVQKSIQFERVLNRKSLNDFTVLNFGCTKIERLGVGEYTVRKCVPVNMVYNFFMNDSGGLELSMIGEFYGLKVKDFREKFGKKEDRPDGMTEKEIFEMARLSNHKNIGTFNYMWNDSYAITYYNQVRPYDDSQILVFDCEVNFAEEQYYVSKKDNYGRENIEVKKNVPFQQKTKEGKIIQQPKPADTEILKKEKNTWMRGVYVPNGDKMLYWGKPDLIITPYTNTAKPLSSYTPNIPNNDGEYVPSLFERIMEPLREYQLTKLKRKQLIAKLRPSGYRVDVENARNIDIGNGDSVSWEEVVRINDQTGIEIWSSKGIDPLTPQAPAISAGTQDDTIQKIIGLTQILQGIVMEIRQLIGVPQYRDGSDVGDRTSGVLQEQQNTASYNVSDFVLNANNQMWEETFYKLCLLKWNDVVKQEPESKDDMINTRFEVNVKMKSSDYQKELLEKDIDRYSQMPDALGQPSLTPKDAMYLREIDNDRLARWYMVSMYNENRKRAEMDKDKREQANIQSQQQTAEQAGQMAEKQQQDKLAAEKDMLEFKATKDKEIEFIKVYGQVASKDESGRFADLMLPIMQQLIPNLVIPLAQENKQMGQQVVAQAQQEQMVAQQQEMEAQGQMPPQEQQMQPAM